MARRRRIPRPARRAAGATPYPIGTRLADLYGVDLDREAREGRPGDFRQPPAAAAARRSPWCLPVVLALVAVALLIVERARRPGPVPVAVPGSDRSFRSLRAAALAGALRDGTLPDFVPDSADRIAVRGQGDWVAFRLPPTDLAGLRDRLAAVSPSWLARLGVVGIDAAWWPAALRRRGRLDDLGSDWTVCWSTRARVGVGDGTRRLLTEFVALDAATSRVYVWRSLAP